ncbi:MAG: hypothetical protein ACMUJM_25920 [bacterium]
MSKSGSTDQKNRVICLPFSQEQYNDNISVAVTFRALIDLIIREHPDLFPPEISSGYQMKDLYHSKKILIIIRRIKIAGISYTIRPSFVMPYLVGMVDEIEKPLFFRKFDVPFWALSYGFGRDPSYWHRIEQSLGRNNLVAATIKDPENLPQHLVADEKHTWILGIKAYLATTVGQGCILGACIAKDAGEQSLTDAYSVYKEEAQRLKPDYTPKTVNNDGWPATRKAWKNNFPTIFLIACFLHVFIKIRDRSKKKFKDIYQQVATKLWDCYEAQNKASFSQRVRRLYEWAKNTSTPSIILEKIEKLKNTVTSFSIAYDFPGAHRTSNMLDRLMQRMDRHLFNTQYFHGSLSSAQLGIRGWALIQNFAPSNPLTIKKYNGSLSPAERLNKFRYHDNWLQNLLISTSLVSLYRPPPQNPI